MSTGAGQIVLDTDLDAIEAGSNLKPVCRVVANAAQSLADATQVAITFLQEDIDTHGFHSTSVNTSRITPNVPGIYRFTGTVLLAARNDFVSINTIIRKNGATNIAPANRKGNNATSTIMGIGTTLLSDMNGTTDYMEITMLQDNSANVAATTNQSLQLSSVFECEFVRGPA